MNYYQEFEQRLIHILSTHAWKVMPIVQLALGLICFKTLVNSPALGPQLLPIPASVQIALADVIAAGVWVLLGRSSWYARDGKMWRIVWIVETTGLLLAALGVLSMNLGALCAMIGLSSLG